MESVVQTNITKFLLLGFSDLSWSLQASLFMFFLSAYIFTLVGNSLIIITVSLDSLLRTLPMYFFLRNLSFHEIAFTTSTVPKVLENILSNDKSISLMACAAQMFIVFSTGGSEFIFLGVMALDRYMAIFNPLRYTLVMTVKLCYQLTIAAWAIGSLVSLGQTIFVFSLPYCGPNQIAHFFCDITPLLRLACSNIFLNELVIFIASLSFAGVTFVLIISSYIYIVRYVMALHSSEGRSKALSTCTSHMVSVILFFGTALSNYTRLDSRGFDGNDRMLSILYCLVIPAINPLIYTLRNKDMKAAIRKLISKIFK